MKTKHPTSQLSLPFDFPKPERENYWKKYFGFEPKPGELAKIDVPIAFCETLGERGYCYMMRTKVIEVTGETARVETTEEWQKACRVTDGANCAGNIWIVDVEDLAPVWERKQKQASKKMNVCAD